MGFFVFVCLFLQPDSNIEVNSAQVSSRVRTSVAVCSPWWFPKDRKDALVQAELLAGLPDFTLLLLLPTTEGVYRNYFQQMEY